MERSEERECFTCGGKIISPKKYYTSDAIHWLTANGWRMTVNPQEGVRYFCPACGQPKTMED